MTWNIFQSIVRIDSDLFIVGTIMYMDIYITQKNFIGYRETSHMMYKRSCISLNLCKRTHSISMYWKQTKCKRMKDKCKLKVVNLILQRRTALVNSVIKLLKLKLKLNWKYEEYIVVLLETSSNYFRTCIQLGVIMGLRWSWLPVPALCRQGIHIFFSFLWFWLLGVTI